MPFKSEAQRRYLWMHEPDIAKRWAHKYGSGSRRDTTRAKAMKMLKKKRGK